MIEVPFHRDEARKKPKVAMEYNTMGGVDRIDLHLTNYPVTKKRGKKYYKKNILPPFGYIVVECFCFILEA